MTTPALTALREFYPNAYISVLAKPWVEPVFSEHPSVDEVISFGMKGHNGSAIAELSIAKSLKARDFDFALLFPNSFASALMVWLARIPRRIGYATDSRSSLLTLPITVPEDRGTTHEVYYYLRLVECLQTSFLGQLSSEGGRKAAIELSLKVPAQGESGAERILEELGLSQGVMLTGFNPGAAYGPAKCWPAERFSSLGNALIERFDRCHILVFGTEKEESVAAEICTPFGKRGHNLAGKTSLVEAMGLISRLDLLVTNDSGLMHVGAALDVPLVAIFGSTNPVTTGPFSTNSMVVRHELPCSPCLKRSCPTDFGCMLGIGVEEVFQACLQQLNRIRGLED